MKRGFTLVELLVVISIIALLSSIVISSVNEARERARIAAGRQFASSILRAVGDQPGGYWKFDECSGATALDASGNGSNGTAYNATYSSDTPSGSGCSLNFTGASNSYVEISASTRPELAAVTEPGTPGFTIAGWYKLTALPTPNPGYIIFRTGYHVGLYVGTAGVAGGTLWYFDNTATNLPSTLNLTDGKWHHLAMSANESNKRMFLFIDGKEVFSAPYTKDLRTYGTGPYRIGGNSGYMVAGFIDEPMIFGGPIK
jgi:prepilin-type N-terminal cleavage/methylation domain-containing protein